MFDLSDVRYIEGAPVDWRRWLTPGTPVTLRLEDLGVHVVAHGGADFLSWAGVSEIAARGSDEPDIRWVDERWPTAADVLAGVRRGPKSKFCWLVLVLPDGAELIFEVLGLLRVELEDLLEEHAG